VVFLPWARGDPGALHRHHQRRRRESPFLDPATGNLLRNFVMKNRANGEPAVWNGIIYVSDVTGNLIAIGQ